MRSRFGLAGWTIPASPGPLLSGTAKIIRAVDADGLIAPHSWGQLMRRHLDAEVFKQLWVVGRHWPTASRMRLYGRGLQHEAIGHSPTVLASVAADLTAAMIRTPDRAWRDHIRYFVHGCLEWQLRAHHASPERYAACFLALWECATAASMDEEQQHLLLWRVMARTVERAPVYWPAGTRVLMMPDILAAMLDGAPMPPALAGTLLLVAAWNHTDGVALASRTIPALTEQFLPFALARPRWRLAFENALHGAEWPQSIPRLEETERHALLREDLQPSEPADDDEMRSKVNGLDAFS